MKIAKPDNCVGLTPRARKVHTWAHGPHDNGKTGLWMKSVTESLMGWLTGNGIVHGQFSSASWVCQRGMVEEFE